MARPSLSSLLSETPAAQQTGQTEADEQQQPTSRAKAEKPAPTPDPARQARPQRKTELPRPANAGPRYLELLRKEARFTDKQYQDLTMLSRQLNKARQGSGERITENTLIRVAVDLLLKDHSQLAGVTEEELRKSVGL